MTFREVMFGLGGFLLGVTVTAALVGIYWALLFVA